LAEQQQGQGDTNQPFLEAKIVTSEFYFSQLMPRISAHAQVLTADCGSMMVLTTDQL